MLHNNGYIIINEHARLNNLECLLKFNKQGSSSYTVSRCPHFPMKSIFNKRLMGDCVTLYVFKVDSVIDL